MVVRPAAAVVVGPVQYKRIALLPSAEHDAGGHAAVGRPVIIPQSQLSATANDAAVILAILAATASKHAADGLDAVEFCVTAVFVYAVGAPVVAASSDAGHVLANAANDAATGSISLADGNAIKASEKVTFAAA